MMASKKGMSVLMPFIALIFLFLAFYTLFLFLAPSDEGAETLHLGQGVIDIVEAEATADAAHITLTTIGRYALLETLETQLKQGILPHSCGALYAGDHCLFNAENFVSSLSTETSHQYIEAVQSLPFTVPTNTYHFRTRLEETSITFDASSNGLVTYETDAERSLDFMREPSFIATIPSPLQPLEHLPSLLTLYETCLLTSADEQLTTNIAAPSNGPAPGTCFSSEKDISNVQKINGILTFDYELQGTSIISSFTVPITVDLEGFKNYYSLEDVGESI